MSVDTFRPTTFEEYIGQEAIKVQLKRRIDAARIKGTALNHVLLAGTAGCGKSSLAHIIAHTMGWPFEEMTLPFRPQQIRHLEGWTGILFIDEIHSATAAEQVELLLLLESGYLHNRKSNLIVRPDKITVIGATTEEERLQKPLRERFSIKPVFVEYTDEELNLMVRQKALLAGGYWLAEDYAARIAKASGGSPREIKNIVEAYDAYVTVVGVKPTIEQLFSDCQMGWDGLKQSHLDYLAALNSTPEGRLGLDGLRNILSLPSNGAVMDREQLLLRLGYIQRTASGRTLTNQGLRRLNSEPTEQKGK